MGNVLRRRVAFVIIEVAVIPFMYNYRYSIPFKSLSVLYPTQIRDLEAQIAVFN